MRIQYSPLKEVEDVDGDEGSWGFDGGGGGRGGIEELYRTSRGISLRDDRHAPGKAVCEVCNGPASPRDRTYTRLDAFIMGMDRADGRGK